MNNIFQTFVLIVCGFVGVIGVLIFAGYIPLPGGNNVSYAGNLTLWGPIPDDEMSIVVSAFNEEFKDKIFLSYKYVSPESFETDLVSELARGLGPDLVIFPQSLILKQQDKLYQIPYTFLSEREFKDTFAQIGELFLMKNGSLALPLYVDPVVMYWNRDLFANAGIASYPKTWVEFLKLTDLLTKKDNKGNVFQSTVAFGTYDNVSNAKDILLTLMLQSEAHLVDKKSINSGEEFFDVSIEQSMSAIESVVNFYTEFANQSKTAYSWNSSMPLSKKAFEAGNLAVYFGKASEYYDIKRNNPHLNFDVAIIPQRDKSTNKITFGEMNGLAVLKNSSNINSAMSVVGFLTDGAYGKMFAKAVSLPSLRNDVLSVSNPDPVFSIFNQSAIISKGWYDPNPVESDKIFGGIINSVLSGRMVASEAINEAKNILKQYVK
ncbi:MAG: extracellular solute-binding protein [bacterium]